MTATRSQGQGHQGRQGEEARIPVSHEAPRQVEGIPVHGTRISVRAHLEIYGHVYNPALMEL